jgi:hypothetical protein
MWYEACPKPRQRIHFWPVTRSGNSIMISSYFGSDICSLCKTKCVAQGSSRASVCGSCRRDKVNAVQQALSKLNAVQSKSRRVADRCNKCNKCFEDASTFAQCRAIKHSGRKETSATGNIYTTGIVTPLANCTCIDCPTTYERHRLREVELEALAICEALDVI